MEMSYCGKTPGPSCDTTHMPTSKCNQVISLLYFGLIHGLLAHPSVSRD